MNCQDCERLLPDYLSGEISTEDGKALEEHLRDCESCRETAGDFGFLWDRIEHLPTPETNVPSNVPFDRLEKETNEVSKGRSGVFRLFRMPEGFARAAAVFLVFAVGFGGGYVVKNGGGPAYDREIVQLRDEMNQLNRLIMSSLLSQSSPSARIQGVNWAFTIDEPDEQVFNTLLSILEYDPNINVRLASLDAIAGLPAPGFEKILVVRTFGNQTSPIIQTAIIDYATQANVASATEVFEEQLFRSDINVLVRRKLENGLAALR